MNPNVNFGLKDRCGNITINYISEKEFDKMLWLLNYGEMDLNCRNHNCDYILDRDKWSGKQGKILIIMLEILSVAKVCVC